MPGIEFFSRYNAGVDSRGRLRHCTRPFTRTGHLGLTRCWLMWWCSDFSQVVHWPERFRTVFSKRDLHLSTWLCLDHLWALFALFIIALKSIPFTLFTPLHLSYHFPWNPQISLDCGKYLRETSTTYTSLSIMDLCVPNVFMSCFI